MPSILSSTLVHRWICSTICICTKHVQTQSKKALAYSFFISGCLSWVSLCETRGKRGREKKTSVRVSLESFIYVFFVSDLETKPPRLQAETAAAHKNAFPEQWQWRRDRARKPCFVSANVLAPVTRATEPPWCHFRALCQHRPSEWTVVGKNGKNAQIEPRNDMKTPLLRYVQKFGRTLFLIVEHAANIFCV